MSPVDYLILNIRHRTNEDWLLDLPLAIPLADLAGANVRLAFTDNLKRKRITIPCFLDGQVIKTRSQAENFLGLEGTYKGDVLLTLASTQAFVTHILNLELARGVSSNG